MRALREGRDDEARACLGKISGDDQEFGRARNLLAQVELRGGRLEEALGFAKEAVAVLPGEVGCRLTLARVHDALEDFAAARKVSGVALEIDNDHFDAWFSHGNYAFKMSDYGAAAEAFRRANALEPDRVEPLVNLGGALDRLGRPDEALQAYEKALELRPESPPILLNVGRMHGNHGRHREAIAAYERAIAADAEFSDAWVNLAVAYLRAGEPNAGLRAVAKTLEFFPGDRSATSLAMIAYQQLGDLDNYRKLYAFNDLIYGDELGVPSEFGTAEDFNSALADAVLAHPTLIHEPAGKSTRRGYQTGNLVNADDSGVFGLLKTQVLEHIERFLARPFDNSGHPYAQFGPDDCDFYMWATVLDEQGHQDPHIHPAGWVSGVYYVQVPVSNPDDTAGWIEFGRPEGSIPGVDESNTDIVQLPAEAGKLFLFPSYFYHRTIPYHGETPRISIAFDLVPKRLKRKQPPVKAGGRSELQQHVVALMRSGRLDEAGAACREALAADPHDATALSLTGDLMQQQGRLDRATYFFRRAVEADPASLQARLGLIGIARQSREHLAALELANDGLAHDPVPQLHLARADLLIDLGRFDGARADVAAALERIPYYARAAWLAAQLDESMLDVQKLATIEQNCPPAQKSGLQFAMGRLLEKSDPERAFGYYREANQAMHGRLAHAIHPADVDVLKQHFTPQLFDKLSGQGLDSDTPVFIVGMPRTGTTLVEQLLAAHPQINTAGETDLLWNTVGELARMLPAGSQMPADLARLPERAGGRAAGLYLSKLRRTAGEAPRIVDRHLQNHAMLGVIQVMFPKAFVIRCRRSRPDTLWSCYTQWFDYPVPYGYDTAAIGDAQEREAQLQRHWEQVLSLRMLTVDYEELVSDFAGEAQRIVSFCGLDWDPAVLDFHQRQAPVISGDRFGVRRPVYRTSLGRAAAFRKFFDEETAT